MADELLPPIVRATALDALRADATIGLEVRIAATRDTDPEVRAAAADSLETVPSAQRASALAPLLRDPVRAVRIAAARVMSTLAPEQIEVTHRPAFDAALAEFIAVQRLSLDMPGAHLNLAVVYQNQGQTALAEQHHLAALRIDPDFFLARTHLARLYNATARSQDAERVLRAGLERAPSIGDLHYALGLLLAGELRLPEAAISLARAAELMPEHGRAHFNLGLVLLKLGRLQDTQAPLLRAQRLAPLDPDVLQALATVHAQSGQTAIALKWAEKWAQSAPTDPRIRELISRLRGEN